MNLAFSISEITYLTSCMVDDWIFIMIATPFLIGFRVLIPDILFSSKDGNNMVALNFLWLIQIAIPTAINAVATATHNECVWFYEKDAQRNNITMSYLSFNETKPVMLRTSTIMTRIVMTIGKKAVPLSIATTLVLATCWNLFLMWGKRNKRRLSLALKDSLMDDYGDNAATILDAATTVLSRIS